MRGLALAILAGALTAQACAPATFLVPSAGLAAEVVGRYPQLAAGAVATGADLAIGTRQLPQLAPIDLDAARRLVRNGESTAARQMLNVLTGRDAGVAAAARLELARLALDDGDAGEAVTQLQALLAAYSDRAERVPATYLLALAEQKQGDTRAAIARLQGYLGLSDLLAPYVHWQLAQWYGALGDDERDAAETRQALAASGSRRLQIEALERLARAAAASGDLAGAQARWEQIWPLAHTESYRAEVQWQLGSLARQQGDLPGAVAHFRTLVAEYPASERAANALDALNDLDQADQISDYQAGLVRFYRGAFARAIGGFEAQLAAGGSADELAGASYYRALALQRQGQDSAARAAFDDMAATYPNSSLAPDALYHAARLVEDAERYADAADRYTALAAAYPDAPAGQLALFRAGFALRRDNRYDDALAAWTAAAPQAAARAVSDAQLGPALNPRAAILFWSGKTLALVGRQDEARARWQDAAAAGPDDYYGLRAKALLAGAADTAPAALDPARLAPPPADDALTAWLAAAGTDAPTLARELAADVGWRRGAALWALGLRAEAGWEFDDLRDRFAGDPARLYTLGVALRDLGADNAAMLTGERLRTASGAASLYDLPRAVRALLYPAPYADLITTQAARFNVDPFLFLALLRQESSFQPRAQSPARARGLAQVMPATARSIASALGIGPLDDDDLFRPALSIELGAYYLGQTLRQFRGGVPAALAGYNAGPGNAERWLREPGGADPDLYAEQIPYAETFLYVRRVYTNYLLYRDLYNG
ncbi:MAG TPA: transglycosylase SLT domain-containing protein [Chloroflexota bacterium]|nr:transglycosylase SLT domain-containing protein [Chloroflexota bacterium]